MIDNALEAKFADIAIGSVEISLESAFLRSNMPSCESPIEKLMLVGLWTRGVWRGDLECIGVSSLEDLKKSALSDPCGLKSFCAQQVKIGSYRVDFALAVNRPAVGVFVLAVECDGHEFHEKSKEQAARDKMRDRHLAALDIAVLRFTGAEIWADAGGCADEILGVINTRWVDGLHLHHAFRQEAVMQ